PPKPIGSGLCGRLCAPFRCSHVMCSPMGHSRVRIVRLFVRFCLHARLVSACKALTGNGFYATPTAAPAADRPTSLSAHLVLRLLALPTPRKQKGGTSRTPQMANVNEHACGRVRHAPRNVGILRNPTTGCVKRYVIEAQDVDILRRRV